MDNYWNRQFTPHRMDEQSVQMYRAHEGDDHPAANEPLTPRESLTFWAWALGVPAGLACLALIAAYWPH